MRFLRGVALRTGSTRRALTESVRGGLPLTLTRTGKADSMVLLGLTGLVLVLVLDPLTAVGARRRDAGMAVTVLAGVCFPVTWVLWYVRDQHPYQRVHS